jgi:hypothetical protein
VGQHGGQRDLRLKKSRVRFPSVSRRSIAAAKKNGRDWSEAAYNPPELLKRELVIEAGKNFFLALSENSKA